MHYLGIDVGKRTSHFFVCDESGNRLKKGNLPSEPACFADLVRNLMSLCEGVEVAMEAGNKSFALARAMEQEGADVFILHPLDNVLIARSRKKTDQIDAKMLAEQRRRDILPPHRVRIPTEAEEDLRHLVTAREALVDERAAMANRAQATLSRYGIFTTKRALKTTKGWRGIREQSRQLRPADRLIVQQYCRVGIGLCGEVARLERAMDKHVATHWPELRRLLETIPGVGRITACSVLAWTSDVTKFPTARQFANYSGLTPSVRMSGKLSIVGGTRGTGNSHLGRVFVQAATVFAQRADHSHELFVWYDTVRRRRGWKKARVALGRKLAAVAYGVLKHGHPYDPKHIEKRSA